jgi:hypothetical protein
LNLYAFQNSARFSLIAMFWPFPGLLAPTMTSVSRNQCRKPRFRGVPFIYRWSKVRPWTKDNSCPQEFLGTNMRNQTGPRVFFLTSDFLRDCHHVIHGNTRTPAPLISHSSVEDIRFKAIIRRRLTSNDGLPSPSMRGIA